MLKSTTTWTSVFHIEILSIIINCVAKYCSIHRFNDLLTIFGPKNGLVVDPLSWHRSMMATTLPIKNCFLKNINFCWNPPQNLRQEPLKNEIYASFADSPIIIELICALTGLSSDHYFKMVLPLPCLKLFLGVKKRSPPPLLLILSVTNSNTELVYVSKIDFIGTISIVHFTLFYFKSENWKKRILP